jgi:RNA polymerase sigma factor (sigma-70 family)
MKPLGALAVESTAGGRGAPPETARPAAAFDLAAEIGRLHSDAFRWALSCCWRDHAEAEEVLQTSYLKLLDGRARFRGTSTFKTFLYSVIRRTAAERRRRERVRRALLLQWSPVSPPTVEQGPPPAVEVSRLRAALGALSSRQRETLELVFAHDLTLADAAAALGISLGSASVHYARGKERLRGLLAEDHP